MIPEARIDEVEGLASALVADLAEVPPGEINRDLLSRLGNSGLISSIFDEEAGSATELCAIRQGLARVTTEAETAFALQGLGGHPIWRHGSPEVRERWIPAIAAGKAVAAFALTEPEAGSDAASLAMAAIPDGSGYRLNGTKTFISNAPHADVYTVFARTSGERGASGVSAFAVPGEADGLSGSTIDLISPHPIGRIVFDEVFVDSAAILSQPGNGFRVAMETLDLFRPSVGAFAVGMAEQAIGIAVEYAMEREAFGHNISRFQGLSHQIADMRTRIEAAALLVYSAAHAHDSGGGPTVTGKAAMAKVFATETAQDAVDVAIQVLGARGLEKEGPLAHLYLEVRGPRIYEGTSEIQRNIIAREIFSGRI